MGSRDVTLSPVGLLLSLHVIISCFKTFVCFLVVS